MAARHRPGSNGTEGIRRGENPMYLLMCLPGRVAPAHCCAWGLLGTERAAFTALGSSRVSVHICLSSLATPSWIPPLCAFVGSIRPRADVRRRGRCHGVHREGHATIRCKESPLRQPRPASSPRRGHRYVQPKGSARFQPIRAKDALVDQLRGLEPRSERPVA